jgi:hypothetical protein
VRALSLQIAAAVVVVALGVPLTFFPLRWARAIGWTIPEDVNLARYFARCLGVMALAISALAIFASLHAEVQMWVCTLSGGTLVAIALVHVAGALEKAQPFFETVEIAIYACAGGYFLWLGLGVQ